MTDDAETVAKQIYVEAARYFSPTPSAGIKILNGPPSRERKLPIPILFIGFQPGGDAPDLGDEQHAHTWPLVYQMATHPHWDLAEAMQRMFCVDLLRQCSGLNAIFVRAPRIADYEKHFSKQERTNHADFCLPCVGRLVEVMKPQAIVAIGLASLRLFGPTTPGRRRANSPLVETGKLAGRDAISTLHLSGCQISKLNRRTIAEDVLAYLQQQGVAVEMRDGRICAVASPVAPHSTLEASAAT